MGLSKNAIQYFFVSVFFIIPQRHKGRKGHKGRKENIDYKWFMKTFVVFVFLWNIQFMHKIKSRAI
jgi:hypothetical protein